MKTRDRDLDVESPNLEAQGYAGHSDRGDCTIRATMAVTGRSYKDVRAAFAKAGRRPGFGCNKQIQYVAWEYLGYRFVRTDHSDCAKTLGSLQKHLVKFGDTLPLLVYTRHHLTAFVNTRCIEWLGIRTKVYYHGTGRLERVRGAVGL